jgi:hypothetical protein
MLSEHSRTAGNPAPFEKLPKLLFIQMKGSAAEANFGIVYTDRCQIKCERMAFLI